MLSGSIAEDGVLEVEALRPSSESKYEQIIRLVREAERKKAPFVRLASKIASPSRCSAARSPRT